MIGNLRPDTLYAVHLRAPSKGTDWVGSITDTGEIHTYWGRTGEVVHRASKPGTMDDLKKRIDGKINSASCYQQVDEYRMQQGWQSRMLRTVSSQQQLKVDWGKAPGAAIEWDF